MLAYRKSNTPNSPHGQASSSSSGSQSVQHVSGSATPASRHPQRRTSGLLRLPSDPSHRRSLSPAPVSVEAQQSPISQAGQLEQTMNSERPSISPEVEDRMHRAIVQLELRKYIDATDEDIDFTISGELLNFWQVKYKSLPLFDAHLTFLAAISKMPAYIPFCIVLRLTSYPPKHRLFAVSDFSRQARRQSPSDAINSLLLLSKPSSTSSTRSAATESLSSIIT